MKTYFVSYFFKKKNGDWGFGNSIIGIDRPMESTTAIREVESSLREESNFAGLAIVSYKEVGADIE